MKTALVLGTVVAAFVGGWVASDFSQRSKASIVEIAEASDFAVRMEKYRASARESEKTKAEQALWLQLGEQLAFRRRNNPTFPADLLSIDAAYTYVRLSDLARERGDQAASLGLIKDAVAVCKQSKSVNCGAAELRKIMRVIDGKEKP